MFPTTAGASRVKALMHRKGSQPPASKLAAPADEVQIAKRFTAANKDRIAELLETLSSLGKARQLDDGRYVPV